MKKILVIEDEPTIREAILEILEDEGFSTTGAENGNLGVKLACKHIPDLILCDVMMAGMDGYDVLSTLRQIQNTAAIPFVFLTARGDTTDLRRGMELGADDYLTKPCSVDDLLKTVHTRLEKQALLHEQSEKKLEQLRTSIALSLPHELRTPLNGILGFSEVLISEYDSIDRQEVLEIAEGIYSSAQRLHQLIQNFLLYAELEIAAGNPERIKSLRNDRTHYSKAIIADAATRIAEQSHREADLRLNLQDSPLAIADLKLKKVVEEVIKNAFKFSLEGTPVEISSVVGQQALIVQITNQGRGMTAAQIAHFGAYVQFERRFHEQQGTGLGLAIAKRLVELHGGELSIQSVPHQQTTITITLPI